LSIKTERKIHLEVGDRLKLFIRETKLQKLWYDILSKGAICSN
jgi:hypothetical protein